MLRTDYSTNATDLSLEESFMDMYPAREYSTFGSVAKSTTSTTRTMAGKSHRKQLPLWYRFVSHFVALDGHHSSIVWKAVVVVSVLAVLVVNQIRLSHHAQLKPDMMWEYNHFDDGNYRSKGRNLLLIQISNQNDGVADVTSKPNRAYARHWGYDFLLYTVRNNDQDCTTGFQVMQDLYQKQQLALATRKYDMVLLMRDDSVIVDLEFDIRSLLPEEKLVALPGWSSKQNLSGITLWNTKHAKFDSLSQHVLSMATACTDLSLWNVDDQMVEPLNSSGGFVDSRHLLYLSNYSTIDPTTALVKLQAVTNSVCYRYFPKCEILQ